MNCIMGLVKKANLEYDYGLTSSCVVVKGLGRVSKLKRKEKVSTPSSFSSSN